MYAVRLEELREGGEKALKLATLLQKGFPVPPGFVVTKEACQKALESPGGEELPEEVLREVKGKYEELSFEKYWKELEGKARDLIAAGREQAFVAVRGKGFTILNVRGLTRLQKALREVWAQSPGEVIVQKMADGEVAGAVSPHPTKEEVVVEASWGLALFDRQNPDLFRIDGQQGIRAEVAEKAYLARRDNFAEQTILEKVPEKRIKSPSLSEGGIRTLLQIHRQAEEALGGRQLLEFVVERGRPSLLQAEGREKGEFSPPETEGELVARGEVVFPGSGQGKVRKAGGLEDLEQLEAGEVLAIPFLSQDVARRALEAGVSAIVFEKGSLLRAGRLVGVPCLRVENISLLQDGDGIFVDAVGGGVYKKVVEEEPEAGEGKTEGVPEVVGGEPAGAKILLSLSSFQEELPGVEGVVLRGESLLGGEGKHPSLLAQENPEELVEYLASCLESLARRVFPRPVWYRGFEGRTDEFQGLEGAEEKEQNPLLGWHGIRRVEEGVFKLEVEALGRVVDKGVANLCLLLPFVSSPEEVRRARELVSFPLKMGVVVETPAACLQIEGLCREGIFTALIDLDSLIQLVEGKDIDNPKFAQAFSSLSPGVERLVREVLETCKKYRVQVSVKGEACNNPKTLEFLLEAGVSFLTTDRDSLEQVRGFLKFAQREGKNNFGQGSIGS